VVLVLVVVVVAVVEVNGAANPVCLGWVIVVVNGEMLTCIPDSLLIGRMHEAARRAPSRFMASLSAEAAPIDALVCGCA
jgi:hypothetical protein